MGRGAGLTLLVALVAAPIGGLLAVLVARSALSARGRDVDDGIAFVVPALLGAAVATLLVLVVAAAVLAARGDRARCVRAARWAVLVPVAAVLPFTLVLLLLGSPVAVPPAIVTAAAAGAVWRSARVGAGVVGLFLVAGVTTVAVLGLDAVILLLPHLVITVGCWAVALGLLGPEAFGRPVRSS